MKRDMDLIRNILFRVEEHPQPDDWVPLNIDGYTPQQISYHVMLLSQAGLITAIDVSSSSGFELKAIRLTWQGHEFLDASKDDTRWNSAKRILADQFGAFPFEILKEILFRLMSNALPS